MGTYAEVSAALLALRIVVGLTLAAHGWNKVFGGGRIPGTARWFDKIGMRPNGRIHAVMAAGTEIGAGTLFALGLLTPLAAAGFVGLMTVAAWTVHARNGFFIAKEGFEYNLVLAVVAVVVAVAGPGRYSLDWVFGLGAAFNPALDLALSAGLGLLAGIGLLAACFRPPGPAGAGPAGAGPAGAQPGPSPVEPPLA
ncbi:MAG: DoxX family protein [Actinobacteria bacterium]|nr:DoxX family protein [Actinomycetota bacterium]